MRLSFCCMVLVLLPQCGPGAASHEAPKSAADDAESSTSPSDRDQSKSGERGEQDEDPASNTSSSSSEGRGANCDDGSCSNCGSGICPSGWYCDERAAGGAACSWLAECAEKPSCGCVTRVLGSSCKCREEGGGLKVACD